MCHGFPRVNLRGNNPNSLKFLEDSRSHIMRILIVYAFFYNEIYPKNKKNYKETLNLIL